MDDYAIQFTRSARKELEGLNSGVLRRIFPEIESLATVPRPPGCRKLQGHESLWRIRIGDYRVVYSIDEKNRLIDIIAVRQRGDAYQ